ncbi:MAG: hypothetical protein KAI72_05855, partial [Candidatus Pacebacteria bacterium]|nr:hypothetical protein [Candidatus Paceibacterota bacterium]
FLPPGAVRILLDPELNEISGQFSLEYITLNSTDIEISEETFQSFSIREIMFSNMLEESRKKAEIKSIELINGAKEEMNNKLNMEIDRLVYLSQINKSIREEEISELRRNKQNLEKYISSARLRLDSLRIIIPG